MKIASWCMIIAGVLVAVAPWAGLSVIMVKWIELVLGIVLVAHGLFGAKCVCMKQMCDSCKVDMTKSAGMPPQQ